MSEEKSKSNSSNRASGGLKYGLFQILCGAGTIGCAFPFFEELEKYNDIRKPLDDISSDITLDLSLPLFIIGCGAVLVLSGALSVSAYCCKKRFLLLIALILALAAGGAQIYFSLRITDRLNSLLDKLLGNPVSDDTFAESDKDVMDFLSAVFNTCCLPDYDSRDYLFADGSRSQLSNQDGTLIDDNQREVNACVAGDLEATCPSQGENRMFPDIVGQLENAVPELVEILCACVSDQDKYDTMVQSLQADDSALCASYRDVVIENAGAVEIPTTPLTFDNLLDAIKAVRDDYQQSSALTEFAVVGKMLPPESTFGEPEEEIGYSCGIGYAKGSGYVIWLFLDGSTSFLRNAAFGLGVASLVGSVALILYLLMSASEDDDDDDDMDYNEIRVKGQVEEEKPHLEHEHQMPAASGYHRPVVQSKSIPRTNDLNQTVNAQQKKKEADDDLDDIEF